MKKEIIIRIPVRDNAPETNISVQIVYKDEESLQSKPFVFMLPGGPGANHSNYMDYDCLQEEANIIYFDPRGCGLSDKGSPSTYTMDNYIDDLHYVITEGLKKEGLKIDQVILLGKSYGAMSGLGYTLRYPKEVSKLILAAGSPSNENLETAKSHVLARGTEEQKKICDTLWAGTFKNNEEVEYYFTVMDPFYSWKIRNSETVNRPKSIYPFSFEALNEGFRTKFWNFNFVDQLHTIQCPTLILVGKEDWITDPIYSKQMAEKIPSSTLKVFEKSDHSMESDVPELFFASIAHFITQTPSLQQTNFLFFKQNKSVEEFGGSKIDLIL